MPNWCSNNLQIKGKEKDLLIFKKKFEGKPALYAPNPKEYDSEIERIALIKEDKIEHKNLKLKPCFNSLYPVPKEVLDIGFDGNYRYSSNQKTESLLEDGYDWQSKNWGTKWDIYNNDVETYCNFIDSTKENDLLSQYQLGLKESLLIYKFNTAWSPPINWLIKVAQDFPTLFFKLTYIEENTAFGGEIVIKRDDYSTIEYDGNDKGYKEFAKQNFGINSYEYEEEK